VSPETVTRLRELVANDPELQEFVKNGDDVGLAAALSTKLPLIPKPKTFIGERGIYDLLKTQEGEVFLQTVESLPTIETPMKSTFQRVVRWLKDPIGLDVGSSETQEQLQALVPPFSQDSVDKLIAFGSQPQVFTIEEVAQLR